jgi:hypothetical protein
VETIWKVLRTLAVLSLLPLAIAVHVQTRAPTSKPKPFVARLPPISQLRPLEPPRRYTICGIAGACWEVGGRPIH